jgi:hypothetical protein
MAKVTLGALINSLKGSIGEMVFSTWKGKPYVRSKAQTISNPQSADQTDVRSRIAECAKYWAATLTPSQRSEWEAYALTIPAPTSGPGDIIKPGKGPFSGFTAFVRNNLNMFISGQCALGTFQEIAPIGTPQPDAPTAVAAAWNSPNLAISWTPGTVPGAYVVTWAKGVRSFHAQITNVTAVGSGISQATNVNVAGGASIPLTTVRDYASMQVIAYDNLGQPSNPSVVVNDIFVNGI